MINQLLNDHKINESEIFNMLNSLSDTGSEYSDLYFQHSVAESWVLDEGIVKDGSYNISHGVGARCVSGDKTGFSYSDDLNIKAIEGAVNFAKGISDSNANLSSKIFLSSSTIHNLLHICPLLKCSLRFACVSHLMHQLLILLIYSSSMQCAI